MKSLNLVPCAGVVKLVDAEDSKSSERKFVSVQFRPPAPKKIKGLAIWVNPFFCGWLMVEKNQSSTFVMFDRILCVYCSIDDWLYVARRKDHE